MQEEEVLGKAYDGRLMKRLLGYLRPYRWQVAVALTSIILKAAFGIAGPFLTGVLVDKYLSGSSSRAHGLLDSWLNPNPWIGIAQVAGLYLGSLILSLLLEYSQTYLMLWTGQMAMSDLRLQIYRHLQHMHAGFFDKNPVGRLVTRVTSDVDAINEMFTAGVVSIFEDVFLLLDIMITMLLMQWWLALIAFAALPPISWATAIFRRVVRDSYRRMRVAVARINSFLQEHVTGMTVLQLFNREERAFQSFEKVNEQNMLAWKDAILAHAFYYPAVDLLSVVAIAAVIWFGGNTVIAQHAASPSAALARHAVTPGILVTFILYAQRFFRPIMDLSDKFNILQSAMASSERIFKLLDTPAEVVSPEHPETVQGPGRIELDHVWFAYRTLDSVNSNGEDGKPENLAFSGDEPTHDWILRDVSFAIEPGETVAIVGHTGAGKTTIISLLMRFYDVQRGSIKIDGVDIRNLNLQALRRRFGVVLQDPFLFSGTIEDNIRLGSTWISDAQVESAAEGVNVADFIHSLPNGFKEPVLERGNTMSTGQKQLISFARALAHNPKILILDEATSSVDTETELRVRNAVTHMVEGRTSVIIAHRLSTIQSADKIIVMHKGQVREIGNHRQLLAARGIYWKLYQLQYKDQELSVSSMSADD